MNPAKLRCAFFLLATILLIACSPSGSAQPDGQAAIYRPPTLVASATAATPTIAAPSRPTPTPPCADNQLTYEKDLNIPDGSVVDPGTSLDKQWLVRNSGSCNWDSRYRIRLIAGPDLGAAKEQALYPARSGSEVTLQMQFTAPSDPGTYRSAWQAYAPSGDAFGDPVFIEVVVQSK